MAKIALAMSDPDENYEDADALARFRKATRGKNWSVPLSEPMIAMLLDPERVFDVLAFPDRRRRLRTLFDLYLAGYIRNNPTDVEEYGCVLTRPGQHIRDLLALARRDRDAGAAGRTPEERFGLTTRPRTFQLHLSGLEVRLVLDRDWTGNHLAKQSTRQPLDAGLKLLVKGIVENFQGDMRAKSRLTVVGRHVFKLLELAGYRWDKKRRRLD